MSNCNLDHSIDDVKKKLSDQKPFLPEGFSKRILQFLTVPRDQIELNELFHLLKKYDLATDAEKTERNDYINTILK